MSGKKRITDIVIFTGGVPSDSEQLRLARKALNDGKARHASKCLFGKDFFGRPVNRGFNYSARITTATFDDMTLELERLQAENAVLLTTVEG